MKIEMDTTFGVVPSQDDLEWVWDDLQDGVLLQDLLLCSVLPSPQKPSAVFVETPATVNSGYGYDDVITMDMNEWYTNMEMNYGSNNTKSMEQQQHQSTSTLAINDMQNSTVEPTYNEYNYQCHQDFTQEMKSTTTTAMDYLSSASPDVAAAIVQSIPVQQPHFLPENEVTAFLNSKYVLKFCYQLDTIYYLYKVLAHHQQQIPILIKMKCIVQVSVAYTPIHHGNHLLTIHHIQLN
jgi:hypothetical protein